MDQIIADIIRREGGFVDHPADKGGPTKYGITLQTLSGYLGRDASREDVFNLSEMQACLIYDHLYIQKPGFDHIRDPNLRGLVVDCGVNHGTRRAAKWLQQAAGATADGVIGPNSRAAIDRHNPLTLYMRILGIRARFYGKIITRDHSQAAFAHGWMNRLAEFMEVK